MPKFGFNDISEEARTFLGKEDIPIFRESSMWSIEVPIDYRTIKTPEHGWYYYMFREHIYRARNNIELDYKSNPPTQYTRMVLEYADTDIQGALRDRMMGLRSDNLGGILK